MPRKRPLISLCMIMRDEAENLPRALASVQGLVDEMIIVDTGSVDASVEIARSFGAKVYFKQWHNDFSEPRNLAMEKAKGEWILIFDADEEFCKEDIPKALDCTKIVGVEGFTFSTVNYIGSDIGLNQDINLNLRLIRNRKEYRYQGKIHEHLSLILDRTVVIRQDIKVYHYGYMDKQIADKEKVQRNLSMLLEKFEQGKETITNFDYYNLGVEYVRANQWGNALDCFEKASYNLDTNLLWGSSLRRIHLLTLANLGLYEEGLNLAEDVIGLYPNYADLVYIKGVMYVQLKRLPEAVGCFHQCLAMEGLVPAEYTHDAGVCGYKAYFALGKAYQESSHYVKAAEMYRHSLEKNPGALEMVHELLTATLIHGGVSALEKAAQDIAAVEEYCRLLTLVESLANLGQKDLALHYLTKVEEFKRDTDFEHYVRALVYTKQLEWGEALGEVNKVTGESSYYKRAKLLEVTSYWYQNREDLAKQTLVALTLTEQDCIGLAQVFLQQAQNAVALGKQAWPDTQIFKDYEQLLNECHKVLAGG